MTTKTSYLHWPILLPVIVFFSLGLSVLKLVNVSFYLLLLISICSLLLSRTAYAEFWQLCKQYWPLNLAMFGIVAATFLQQLSTLHFTGPAYDLPSRLALFIFLFWIFLQLPTERLTHIKWAWMVGVVFCTIELYFMAKDADGRPDIQDFRVWFIELVMLLTIFSFISIAWNERGNRRNFMIQTVIQLFAGACGIYSVYISATRGVWIAIPIFLFLIFATFVPKWYSGRNLLLIGIVVVISGILFSTTDIASRRIHEAKDNLHLYLAEEDKDTSIGIRLQIWQGSWILFKQNPLFGIGRDQYSKSMKELADRNVITPQAAAFFHSHNEILYNMMTLGIFGLIGILAIYLAPAYYFARELRHYDRAIRASAAMGLSLCLGFMIFGLVDVMLLYRTTDVFYSISIALFLAHIVNRKKQIALT